MNLPSIASCLQQASQLAVSDSARLDVEILLAHVLQKDRVYLFTWPEKTLTPEQAQIFDDHFQRRMHGEPIAHIIGQREFWSLPLMVDNTTLIPRPETELLVETVLKLFSGDAPDQVRHILDLGTGTGAIALALASEKKTWQCLGVDKEPSAVQLAEKNRAHLQLHNATITQSNWFDGIGYKAFDIVVSNPPYIDPSDAHLQQGDVRFEPLSALIADNHGLADIERITQEAQNYLRPNGWLLIEHGYDQGEIVRELFQSHHYREVKTLVDFAGNERATFGQKALSYDE